MQLAAGSAFERIKQSSLECLGLHLSSIAQKGLLPLLVDFVGVSEEALYECLSLMGMHAYFPRTTHPGIMGR